MTSSQDHEEHICKLIMSVIEKRLKDKIILSDRPDKTERKEKAIDFIGTGEKQLYLIEHTFIESHEGRKRDDAHFSELLAPLEKALHKKMASPGYYYRFGIKMGAVKGAKETKKIQERLIAWISKTKDTLKEGKILSEKPDGIPFDIEFSKHKAAIPEIEDRLLTHRITAGSESIEQMRRERIGVAFAKKFPKLQTAKTANPAARSILILESNDIALSNHLLIFEAVHAEIQKRQDAPDDIYLIEMEVKNRPTVWTLKEEGRFFAQIKDYGPHYLSS